jgi:hypothetical protein
LRFAEEVDAFAEGRFEKDVVKGELGEGAGKDFDLCGYVEAVVEDEALFAAHGA